MAIIGGFIVLYGLVSLFVKERMYLSEAFVATSIGILFGPYVLNVVRPHVWFTQTYLDALVLELAR